MIRLLWQDKRRGHGRDSETWTYGQRAFQALRHVGMIRSSRFANHGRHGQPWCVDENSPWYPHSRTYGQPCP